METRNVLNPKALLSAAVSTALLAAAPAIAEDTGRSFEIYGFAQADFIQDFDGRLDPDWDDAFRPSKIGLDEQFGSDGQSSISVKQSRFGVKGMMPTGEGGTPLSFKFEFDLFGTGADAGQTTFRLRHAYGEWGSLLAGPDQQPVHGRRRVPEHDRLLGPGGHGVLPQRADPLDAVQDGQQPLRDRHRASGQRHRLGQPAPDRGLRGPAGAERRDAARPDGAVPPRRRLGPRAGGGHPAQGRLRGARVLGRPVAHRQRDRLGHQRRLERSTRSARTRSCCRSSTARASPAT